MEGIDTSQPAENRRGSTARRWSGNPVMFRCDHCGATIQNGSWRGLASGKRYCASPPCREAHWRATHGQGAWIEQVGPLAVPFKAHNTLCPDGMRRAIRLRSRTMDNLRGVVTIRKGDRSYTVRGTVEPHGDGDWRFVPDAGRANSGMLPAWPGGREGGDDAAQEREEEGQDG